MYRLICGGLTIVFGWAALTLRAEDPVPAVVAALKHPTAIVSARTGEFFILDSGAGKLVRLKGDKLTDIVTDYPTATTAAFDNYRLGPLSVAVLPGDALLIGDGGESTESLIRVFPWAKETPLERGSFKDKIGPLKGNSVRALASTPDAVYALCRDGESAGCIARATLNGTKFGPLEVWAKGDGKNSFDPTAIVIHPEEGHVVVATQGGSGESQDSRLLIYSRVTAKPLLSLSTKLQNVSGLAYSPKTGLLYATDLAWKRPEDAGLYRLDVAFDAAGQAIKATRIAKLERPTALAFGEDGSLYVTLLGAKAADRGGSVVWFKSGL